MHRKSFHFQGVLVFFFLCVRQVNVQLQRSELQMQLKWEIECKTEVEKLSIKCI